MTMISSTGAQTIGPANGGKVTPINSLGTTALQVIGPNPQRASLTFANPGTVMVYVAPLINAVGGSFTITLSALGGSFPILAGGMLTLQGEISLGWQALAASGSNNPLTVSESNI